VVLPRGAVVKSRETSKSQGKSWRDKLQEVGGMDIEQQAAAKCGSAIPRASAGDDRVFGFVRVVRMGTEEREFWWRLG